jgi:hypothetical protein
MEVSGSFEMLNLYQAEHCNILWDIIVCVKIDIRVAVNHSKFC